MGTREIEKHATSQHPIYPCRFMAVTREREFYVIENLLTGLKRYYARAHDVAEIVRTWTPPEPDAA